MYEDQFQKALNIEDPGVLESVDFDQDTKRIDLYLDFVPGTKFDCPVCNKPGCSAYDTKEKERRHLDFFQQKAFPHCRVPRVICDECGIHQIKIPWARESSGFTLLMGALIMLRAQSMQISEIADMIGEHDTRVWRVVNYLKIYEVQNEKQRR